MKTLTELRAFAEANLITLDTVKAMSIGALPPIGDNPKYVREYEGMRIVLSIENQGDKGIYRHASVTFVNNSQITPQSWSSEVRKALGFRHGEPAYEYMEDIGDGREAFNVIQPAGSTREQARHTNL